MQNNLKAGLIAALLYVYSIAPLRKLEVKHVAVLIFWNNIFFPLHHYVFFISLLQLVQPFVFLKKDSERASGHTVESFIKYKIIKHVEIKTLRKSQHRTKKNKEGKSHFTNRLECSGNINKHIDMMIDTKWVDFTPSWQKLFCYFPFSTAAL